jgi:chromosome segregation ATPase
MTTGIQEAPHGEITQMWQTVGAFIIGSRIQIDARFDKVEGKIESVEQLVARIATSFNQRLLDLESRINKLESDMGEVKLRLTNLDGRMDRMEADIAEILRYVRQQQTGKQPD